MLTMENIKRILSKLKYEEQQWNKENQEFQKDFLNIISKLDIRIANEPVIKGDEYYYKIWIYRKGTKNKVHIKQYYPLKVLNKRLPLTLEDVLTMIRLNSDVPNDFEEYCEMHLEDPSDPICRMDYIMDLRRAERFKKFLTIDEIRSFPIIDNDSSNDNNLSNNNDYNNNKPKTIDLNNKEDLYLLGYEIVWMSDKREYDKLVDLQNTLEYYAKMVESYGYNTYTADYDAKKFPITKEDKQMKNIIQDFKNYFKALEEYYEYLKRLIKKYDIKPIGNIVRRLAFNINTIGDDNNLKQRQHFKFITAVVDWQDFS